MSVTKLAAAGRVFLVVSAWLLLFAIGVWVPSRFYLESVIYERPLEWNNGTNGEVIFEVLVDDRPEVLQQLMSQSWTTEQPSSSSDTEEEAERGYVQVFYVDEKPVDAGQPDKTPEAVAKFHVTHSDQMVDNLRRQLYESASTPNADAQSVAAFDGLNGLPLPEPEAQTTDTTADSRDSNRRIRVVYHLLPKGETAQKRLSFLQRIGYMFMGLISGSMVNLAALCVLASIAGEYTRCAIDESRKHSADASAASFRGFVVFLFFISGELLFLGNVTGGPTSDDNLAQLTQSAFVRTAGFASVVCLACSYNPTIIVLFLSKISSLLDAGSTQPVEGAGSKRDQPDTETETETATATEDAALLLNQFVLAKEKNRRVPDSDRIQRAVAALKPGSEPEKAYHTALERHDQDTDPAIVKQWMDILKETQGGTEAGSEDSPSEEVPAGEEGK